MTMMLDAPATTRKEKVMLERKMAAIAEPETTTVTELPVVEQVSTDVVMDDTNLEQSVESVTEPTVEPVADPEPGVILEPSTHDADDDDDVFPETKPRTGGLPMVAFKPLKKDIPTDDDEVPAPPVSQAFFADDWAQLNKVMSDEERAEFFAKERADKENEAKEKADAEAKEEAKRLARIEKRGSKRMLGIIMMAGGALSVLYGLVVTYVPGT